MLLPQVLKTVGLLPSHIKNNGAIMGRHRLTRLAKRNRKALDLQAAILLFTLILVAVSAPAQQCPQACPGSQPRGMVSAEQQTGADGCAKINAGWTALPLTGGVVDARQIIGTQPCASDPFDGIEKAGETLIGGATFQTSTGWVLKDKSIIQGIGRGDPESNNSVIEASSTLSGPVLHLASSPIAFEGVRAENLTVDCNNNDNATGVLDNAAQEESGLRHVLILSCTKIGLDIEHGSQNSSFDDLEILSAGSSSATQPVIVNTEGPIRGIHGITVNTWSQPYPAVAMQIRTMGSYTDMHCEGATTCFYIDADDVTLMNVECGSNVRICVQIAPGVQNVTIMGLFSSAPNGILIENNLPGTSPVLTNATDGAGIGWYSIGDGTPPTVCSSSVYVTCTFKRADPTPSSTPVQRTAVPRTVTPPYLATGSRPNLGQQRARVR